VCLDEWKQHNTSTGGYFECNRYAVRRKAESQLEKRKEEVLEGVEEAEKLRRFIHYYERYKTHKENLQPSPSLPALPTAGAAIPGEG
jgi:ankyrin repeat/IBR domain-containing protein 1